MYFLTKERKKDKKTEQYAEIWKASSLRNKSEVTDISWVIDLHGECYALELVL